MLILDTERNAVVIPNLQILGARNGTNNRIEIYVLIKFACVLRREDIGRTYKLRPHLFMRSELKAHRDISVEKIGNGDRRYVLNRA